MTNDDVTDDDDRNLRREMFWALARLLIGLGVLIGIVSLIGWRYHDELGRIATRVVAHLGLPGTFAGAALADSVMFPVPPQVYLLAGVAAGYSHITSFIAAACGSVVGGFGAFMIGRLLGLSSFIAKRLEKPQKLLERLIDKYGALGLVFASLLPLSYSALCMTTGAMHIPYRSYAVLAVMRVLKLFLSFLLIIYAWRS